MIYLDHAATTPVPKAVADAMYTVLTEQYANPNAQYPFGQEMRRSVEDWRAVIAKAVGCEANQLFFTSCGTEGDNWHLKEKINAMTADVDSLNAQEGYRGTSYESVFLLSASEAGLRKVNEMYVPEQFQAGFSDMIDEYVHFNDSARNSIMERMTPDYMVVGIGRC